jgi:hypothetical protein
MGILLRKFMRRSLRIVFAVMPVAVLLTCSELALADGPVTTTSSLPAGQLLGPDNAIVTAAASSQAENSEIPTGGTVISKSTLQAQGTGKTTGSATVDNMKVSVSGNRILINGSPGSLFGWTFVGINNTTACAASYYAVPWLDWQSYASNELEIAKKMGANTVRFQVALDLLYEPAGQNFDSNHTIMPAYLNTVGNAVALARSKGMAVIVSMQWEGGTSGKSICDGEGPANGGKGNYGATLSGNPAPTSDNAAAAWKALLTSSAWTENTSKGVRHNFNNDSGVLLQIYNEAQPGTIAGAASDWQAWQNALQPLVIAIRGYGANNVLIVPALHTQKVLDATSYGGQSVASYMLSDTRSPNRLIYSVHPYPAVSNAGSIHIGYFNTQDLNNYFGDVANTLSAPVMITEWVTTGGYWKRCWDTTTPKQPSPMPPNYTQYSPNTTSVDITNMFIKWLAAAGPGGTPMSITGTAFEEFGYWLQDPSATNLANGVYTPTNFAGQTDSNFKCGTMVVGSDGNKTYPGPGQDLSNYFLKYPHP